MSKVSYYTEEGLKKLKAELDHLRDVERPKASQAIAEARDKGDLSENAEYDAAKEAQGLLEMKIAKMEETVSNARIIDESQLDTSKALVLSTVKIRNQANKMEMKYTLVAESEADLKTGKISVTSQVEELTKEFLPGSDLSFSKNETFCVILTGAFFLTSLAQSLKEKAQSLGVSDSSEN